MYAGTANFNHAVAQVRQARQVKFSFSVVAADGSSAVGGQYSIGTDHLVESVLAILRVSLLCDRWCFWFRFNIVVSMRGIKTNLTMACCRGITGKLRIDEMCVSLRTKLLD